MKKTLMYMAILTIVFTIALLIKSKFVDPIADEVYSEIYGLEQEGDEW